MFIDINAVLSGDEKQLKTTLLLDDLDTGLFSSDDVDIILPIKTEVTASNTAGLTELSVSADVAYTTRCARCGKDLAPTLPVRFKKPVVASLSSEDNDDILVVDGGKVDVTQLVTEEISFGLPMRHLCREDCAGLCPVCGRDLNGGSCGCEQKQVDPRLADLSKFIDEK